MSINENLLEVMSGDDTDIIYNYGYSRKEVEPFLFVSTPFNKRQKKAIAIIKSILYAHGKENLLECLSRLAIIEPNIRVLKPRARDHVVHALLSHILGAYINERLFMPALQVNYFQWKIAGLLHDVGYPVQISSDILESFENTVNGIKNDLGVTENVIKFLVVPKNLENLSNGINSFDLIQQRIESWGLQIDVESAYNEMVLSGKICHGMISGLAVLMVIDAMYTKYNPRREYKDIYQPGNNINCNQRYFENDIVPACSAIFIHNLSSNYFTSAKIERSIAPTAFLLKLADSLQDWERPSQDDQLGFPAEKYSIEVSNNNLVFHCDIPFKRKEKIRSEVFSCLVADDIKIL